MRCAFAMLDANHDGRVNAEELKGMLDRLGISVDDEVVKKLLSEASKNGKIILMLNYLKCNLVLVSFNYSICVKVTFLFN